MGVGAASASQAETSYPRSGEEKCASVHARNSTTIV